MKKNDIALYAVCEELMVRLAYKYGNKLNEGIFVYELTDADKSVLCKERISNVPSHISAVLGTPETGTVANYAFVSYGGDVRNLVTFTDLKVNVVRALLKLI